MKKNIHIILMLFTMCSVSLLWTGCSNEENNPGLPVKGDYSGEPIRIKAMVEGVENYSSETTTTRSGIAVPKALFVQPLDENKDTGFDIETTIEAVPGISTRADVIMPTVFFRVLAYRNNSVTVDNYAGQGDFMTMADGTANAIANRELSLPEGSYKFVCYSYYTDDVLEPLDPTALTVPVSQSQEFMVCNMNGTVADDGNGAYTLSGIIFKRLCCQLQLEVNVSGFPKDIINTCAATVSNINDNKVNWSIGENSLPQTGTSGSLDFSFTIAANTAVSGQKIALSAGERDLVINLSSLTIADTNYDNTMVTVPKKVLAAAGNYKIKMNVKQNYILVGGYKWAKGNLYQEGNDYLFEATQEAYHKGVNGGGYFGYNTLSSAFPTHSTAPYYSYDTDPCSKAKPLGTWQTPTKIITEALKTSNPKYNAEKHGMSFGTGDNILFLPYTGVRLNVEGGKISGDQNYAYYGLQDEYSSTFYWTFFLYNDDIPDWMELSYRDWGCPIRCVKIK